VSPEGVVVPVRCIAHRGFADRFPENTPSAVRRAVELGADAVEIDVRRCGSGEVVAVHDETVDRVTDATGRVADLSAGRLASLDVLGSGEGVPTLVDLLARLPGGVTANVELKERGLAGDVLEAGTAHDTDLLVSSFDTAALEEAAAVRPAPLAVLFADEPAATLTEARELGCVAVHPHVDLCSPAFVERAHDAGFEVNAWTVGSGETARSLAAAGVDGLISDAPEYCPGGR